MATSAAPRMHTSTVPRMATSTVPRMPPSTVPTMATSTCLWISCLSCYLGIMVASITHEFTIVDFHQESTSFLLTLTGLTINAISVLLTATRIHHELEDDAELFNPDDDALCDRIGNFSLIVRLIWPAFVWPCLGMELMIRPMYLVFCIDALVFWIIVALVMVSARVIRVHQSPEDGWNMDDILVRVDPEVKEERSKLVFQTYLGLREMDAQMACPICLTIFGGDDLIMVLKCSHLFHCNCVQPWLNDHRTCPTCRSIQTC